MGFTGNNALINTTFGHVNKTTPLSPYAVKEPLGVEIFRLTFSSLVALFGVISNIIVCVVFANYQPIRTANNYLILNLSVADLGILLIAYPAMVISTTIPTQWPLGEFVCEKIAPIQEIFQGVAFWSIAAIAIARYRGLQSCYRKTEADRRAEMRKVKLVIVVIWVIAFLSLSLPMYFVLTYNEKGPNYRTCTSMWGDKEMMKHVYMHLRIALTYLFPLIVTVFTYGKIYCKIAQSTKLVKTMEKQGHICVDNKAGEALVSQRKQNKRSMRLLTPLVFVFAVTLLPFNLFRFALIYWFSEVNDWSLRLIMIKVSLILFISHAAINPILYSITYKENRKGLKEVTSNFTRSIRITRKTRSRNKNRDVEFEPLPKREETQNIELDEIK